MILFKNYYQRFISASILIALLEVLPLMISGCAQENPLLYDPTKRDSSVSVRYINLTSDDLPRLFAMDGISGFPEVTFGSSTSALVTPLDSVHFSLSNSSTVEYSTKALNLQKRSFYRGTVQTYISGLSDIKHDSTIIINFNTSVNNQSLGKVTFRALNMIDDPGNEYDIYLGCQNGSSIGLGIGNGKYSGDFTVEPGYYTFTIINSKTKTLIGTYSNSSFQFSKNNTYSIILGKKQNDNTPRLFILDELNSSSNALSEWNIATNLHSYIHTVNLSSLTINTELYNSISNNRLAVNLNTNTSSNDSILSCSSNDVNNIIIRNGNNQEISSSFSTISPFNTYSNIVVDSVLPGSVYSTTVQQLNNNPIATQCNVRIINVNFNYNSIGLNLTSRTDITGKYSSGMILSQNMSSMSISPVITVNAGIFPISIHTTNLPQKLINQYIATLKGGHNYLLIVESNRISVIDENNDKIEQFDKGQFIQIAHAAKQSTEYNISLNTIYQNAKLTSDGVISAVIPRGSTISIASNGKSSQFIETDTNLSLYYIIDESNTIHPFHASKDSIQSNSAGLRLINLVPNVPVDLYLDYDSKSYANNRDKSSLYRSIQYLTSSGYHRIYQDRRLTFSLLQWDTPPRVLSSLNNVLISMGKNYNIIIVPEADNTYRTILRQEF